MEGGGRKVVGGENVVEGGGKMGPMPEELA